MMLEDTRSSQVAMVRASAAAVAPRSGDLSRVRALRFKQPDFDPDVWRDMAELGWIGIALPEERGGIGFGMSETVALAEELGRGLAPEPLVSAALSAGLLAAAGETEILTQLLVGKTLVSTAWAGRPDAMAPPQRGEARRRLATMSGLAEFYLLPEFDANGLVVRLLQKSEVTFHLEVLQDGGLATTIEAPDDSGRLLTGDVGPAFAKAFDEAALATSAYLLGVSERAFEMTLDYLKVRRQFDQSLAAFQALQHRMVDMKIQLTLCRASVEGAAALDAGVDSTARALAVSRAKSRAADTAMLVAREAIQLHGAIGYTDEYDVGLFVRKAMVVANQFGTAASHRSRYAALVGDLAA